jgi:2-polyprenyl-3-methyl-5-hydroxy-6-metoxy-1,4-benzoquinol methylase
MSIARGLEFNGRFERWSANWGDMKALDIGCGHGFDGDGDLQRSLAEQANRFIGIEPDTQIQPPAYFTEVHPCTFEDAPLAPDSVHAAYSAFVLEHVEQPALFWRKLHGCLAPGGVFWGFTVDARHPFSAVSLAAGKLKAQGRVPGLATGSPRGGQI